MSSSNLTPSRVPASLSLSDVDAHLAGCTLKPVGGLELSSRGFVSPFGRDAEALSHPIEDAIWLTVGGEDKILPAAVVTALLGQKLAEMEQRAGRKHGGRARKQLKERSDERRGGVACVRMRRSRRVMAQYKQNTRK